MKNKLQKTDYMFILFLMTGLLFLSIFVFTYPYLYDESCYASIPYRFINGDNMLQHDWHLSQFASLFTYLPVKLWITIKGSADGIIVFLRCVYLCINTGTAIVIYRFFKEYKMWAVAASMIFFTQAPYRILAISYHSVYVICLLFFTLCLISIYKKAFSYLYVFAGFCYGCCCVCNPFFCVVFPIYLLCCALWPKRELFQRVATRVKVYFTHTETRKKKKVKIIAFPEMENYGCFFNKQAILYFFLGILIVFVVFVVFFVAMGGTFTFVVKNLGSILQSSEHNAVSASIVSKIRNTGYYFNRISFNLSFLLPLLYFVMLIDRKRKHNIHRLVYLVLSIALAVLYIFGIVSNATSFGCCVFSLPFAVISFSCFMLTENKNKSLFCCMWMPSLIGTFFQYFAANTHLTAIGVVLVVNNIAGVLFVRDLYKEMHTQNTTKSIRNSCAAGRVVLCCGLCLQLFFNLYVLQYEQIVVKDDVKATAGPYAGIYMNAQEYEHYCNAINDIDKIKERSNEDDPVLIVSYRNWMYIYVDRPVAAFATWYQGRLMYDSMLAYYKVNPERIPKYIYIDLTGYRFDGKSNYDDNLVVLKELFEFTSEKLADGMLLTVTKNKIN